MVAGAQGCLPTDDASLPERITVDATVHVSVTGRVTRASAGGTGLPVEATECIEQRLEAHRFSAPEAQDDRSASTSVMWRFDAPKGSEPAPSEAKETKPPTSGRWIEGPSGVAAQPAESEPASGPSGESLEGPSGTPIEGPKGTPIGQ